MKLLIFFKSFHGSRKNSLYLANVAHDNLADEDLAALASAQNGEFVLAFDSALQSAELSLLGVIIKGSNQDDDYDGNKNCQAFDPFVRLVLLVDELIF